MTKQGKTAEQLRASSLETVVAFLLGEGELDGFWFGEKHERRKGAFWWREYLREAFEFGPIAWESTTPAYFKYITQAKYEKFSPAVRQWYKPYRCSDCANTRADSGEAVAHADVISTGVIDDFRVHGDGSGYIQLAFRTVPNVELGQSLNLAKLTQPRATAVDADMGNHMSEQNQQDVRDAERYRWLRGLPRNYDGRKNGFHVTLAIAKDEPNAWFIEAARDLKLDEAIDAAIANREGE